MNTKKFLNILLLASLLWVSQNISPAHASGTIRHVSSTGLNTGTCTTWLTACNLQRALAVVAVSGDQVWVKQGTYKPATSMDRTVSFILRNGISIYGGFAGTETQLSQRNWLTHITTLSGNIGSPSLSSDNSYHVITDAGVGKTAVIDGFTITSGNASGGGTDNDGGGIFISGSPTLRNLKLVGNKALADGGGVYEVGGNPLFTNVTFSSNSAVIGGGMYNYSGIPTLSQTIFNSNSATSGGGLANAAGGNAILSNVTFSHNTAATSSGGGIYDDGSNPILKGVTLSNNSATYGGGMYNSASSPKLTNVTFNSNTASDSGGGIGNYSGSSPTLTNVTFNSNKATVYGGGIYNNNSSSPTLTNVTFNLNTATNSGGGIMDDTNSSPKLMNVTFAHNAATNFSGGGMLNYNSSAPTLTNVTFASNSAGSGGGGILNETNSSPTLTNVTFSGNSDNAGGGAMYNETGSSPSTYDAIFWKDSTEVFDDALGPTFTDIVISGGCPTFSTCQNFTTSNPFLGPLAINGGFTQTMALGAGSSAIDAGGAISTCATTDQRGVKRPQGGGCDIGAYEVKVMTFTSFATYDGWILESSKGSNIGGSLNSTAATFNVGDNAANRRYRGLLSFNTAPLPDPAAIVMAQLRVTQQSMVGSPFSTQGNLLAELAKPYFGSNLILETSDWQVAATVSPAGSFLPDGSSYWTPLNNSARSNISKTGTTQFRLRFSSDAYNNLADYLSLYSGNYAIAPSKRPELIVYYNP